jgi:hypothetical protein
MFRFDALFLSSMVVVGKGDQYLLVEEQESKGSSVHGGVIAVKILAETVVIPRFARDGVDLGDSNLHRIGLPVPSREVDPQSLALVHGDENATAISPGGRHPIRVVLDTEDRKLVQTWGEGVFSTVVGNPQGPHEADGHARPEAQFATSTSK